MPFSTAAEIMKNVKDKKKPDLVLYWDENHKLLVPVNWKNPSLQRRTNYIAIIIGLSDQFVFERLFLQMKQYERDEELDQGIAVGFEKTGFKDGLIMEEKFSYKKNNSFITETNFYEIEILDDGLWGYKITKSEIKSIIALKQEQIYDRFRDIMESFGEEFCLYTMQSILKQKKQAPKFSFFNK